MMHVIRTEFCQVLMQYTQFEQFSVNVVDANSKDIDQLIPGILNFDENKIVCILN